MRLTKYHKAAFVAAVMADVPKHDYSAEFEKAVHEDMIAFAPWELVPLLKSAKLRPYLINSYYAVQPDSVKIDNRYYYASYVGISSVAVYRDYEFSPAMKAEADRIMLAAVAQHTHLDSLRAMVSGTIEVCSTLKKAHELLPEFVKYLPPEEVKSVMLPAVANLSAALTQAGWPKEAVAA